MKTTELSQSTTVEEILPQFIAENNSEFVQFIKAYYDWMEVEGNTNNVIHTMGVTYEDKFVEDLYQLYLNEYASVYPFNKAVRKDIFLKNIRHVLSCKGSVDSIKHFFRSIYAQEVQVVFPADRRLTYNASDLHKIKTHIVNVDPDRVTKLQKYNSLVGWYIIGEFNCSAKVESVYSYQYGGFTIVEFQISNLINGFFVSGEHVACSVPEAEDPIEFVVGAIISGYEIIDGGSGYSVGQAIRVYNEYQIESCSAIISSVSSTGAIESVSILNNGYGYETDVFGEVIFSSGVGAIIRFIASSSTTLDDTIDTNKLVYIEANKSVRGRDSLGEYVVEGYFQPGYIASNQGSTNPLDYPQAEIRTNNKESTGKHYLEFHVFASSGLNWPAATEFGFSRDTQFGIVHNRIPVPYTYTFSYGLNVVCLAIEFVNGLANIYIGTINDAGIGENPMVCRWLPGNTTEPTTPSFSGVPVGSGLFASATCKITPFQKIKLVTHPAEILGNIPTGFVPWDSEGSATAKVYDDNQLSVDPDVLYRYKIRTSLSAAGWNKIYKAAIHPAGTKYTVDFVDNIDVTGEEHEASWLTVKTSTSQKIRTLHFPLYDIQQREHLVLQSPTDLFGPVGSSAFSPNSGATILDLPTNIFDMDCMVNAATQTHVKITP